MFLTQIVFDSGFAVIFTRKYKGKGIGEGVRYGFSDSCWPLSKSKSFAACRSCCLCRLHRPSPSMRGVCSQVSSYPLSKKKRHPHDLLTRRALCPDRHVRRCGHHIQRRRWQPLSQRPHETRRGLHATPDRSEIGATWTRPVRSGPFRRYRY